MAKCATQTTIYACTVSGSSSCFRSAFSVPVVNATAPESCAGLIVISPSEYAMYQAALQSNLEPFDYVQASAIFAFFFSFVVGCWYVSRNIGVILEAVRRW